jgi:addiction module HigA family antidote
MLKRELSPVHPGEILKEEFIKARKLSITELAEGIGITRANLSAIINKRAGISTEMAVKLSEAFSNSTQFWLSLQKNYELFYAERKIDRSKVKHFPLLEVA